MMNNSLQQTESENRYGLRGKQLETTAPRTTCPSNSALAGLDNAEWTLSVRSTSLCSRGTSQVHESIYPTQASMPNPHTP